MKLFVLFVVMVTLLAALCSAQPVDSSAPEQLKTLFNNRFKRHFIPFQCRCQRNMGYLMRVCVSCETYEDLTGEECPPPCL